MGRQWTVWATTLVLPFGGVRQGRADPFVVDQSNTGPITGGVGFGFEFDLPIGQEFVPTLPSLDDVELFLGRVSSPTPVTINIRAGSIFGPVLGSSTTLVETSFVGEVIHFDFPFPVPLVPGDLYVIELTAPPGSPGSWNNTRPDYQPGRAILGGLPTSLFDFYFAEGPRANAVPEPSTLILFGLGSLSLLGYVRRWRKQGLTNRCS